MNHTKTPGFLAPGGEEFNLGPETRLDRSELLCNKVVLKYKGENRCQHKHRGRSNLKMKAEVGQPPTKEEAKNIHLL